MTKIFGDKQVIERAKKAQAGNKTVYINWDAIMDLPDEYEVIVTEIRFNPNKLDDDFSKVSNNTYMPQPHLMYKIAEACGINGGEKSLPKPITEEVDINAMLMKDITLQPTIRKITVGRSVCKFSTRMQEDGTLLNSSPCTCEFNVWERCNELWAKEEVETNIYADLINSPYEIKEYGLLKKKNGLHYFKEYNNNKYAVEPKYNSTPKRKLHFQSELKFAHAKAETKAHEKTIRELAGLQTGYKTGELKEGALIFSKVRRSRIILQAETAAKLKALSQGTYEKPRVELFDEPETKASFPDPQPKEPEPTQRETLMALLTNYLNDKIVAKEFEESAEKVIKWLNNNKDAESHKDYWPKAINVLREVEKKIPEQGRIVHDIY